MFKRDIVLSKRDIVLSKRDIVLSKRDIVASKRDIVVSKRDIVVSKRDIVVSKRDIVMSKYTSDLTCEHFIPPHVAAAPTSEQWLKILKTQRTGKLSMYNGYTADF